MNKLYGAFDTIVDRFMTNVYLDVKATIKAGKLLSADLLSKYNLEAFLRVIPDCNNYIYWEPDTPRKMVQKGITDERLQFLFLIGPKGGKAIYTWYELGRNDIPPGYTGKWYRINGTIFEVSEYRDGVEHGKQKVYKDGTLIFNCGYNMGELHGRYEVWYDTGKPCILTKYKNGIISSLYTSWYDNGRIYERGNFYRGKKFGIHKKWDIGGKLVMEVSYVDDILHGPFMVDNNNMVKKCVYSNGRLVLINDTPVQQQTFGGIIETVI